MANRQFSTYITKQITSGAYFTRTDEQAMTAEDKELMQLNPELYNQRNNKFDSPNNIKGIMVTTSGIYVETYHGYGVVDKQARMTKRSGQRLKFDRENNKQFVEDLKSQRNQPMQINNNWMFTPVLQNLRYIYFDDQLKIVQNRGFQQLNEFIQVVGNVIIKAPGQKGEPTRQRFPRFKEIAYMPRLGEFMQLNDGKDFLALQNQKDLWQKDYEKLTKIRIATIDFENVKGWGKTGTLQARPDIYKYDRFFIQSAVEREQAAIKEAQEKEKETQKKVDKEGLGISGVYEVKEEYKMIIEQHLIKPVVEAYKFLLEIGFSGPRTNNGMLTGKTGSVYIGSESKIIIDGGRKGVIADSDLYRHIAEQLEQVGLNVQQLQNKAVEAAQSKLEDSVDYITNVANINQNGLKEFSYAYSLRLIKGYLKQCKMSSDAYKDDMINNTRIINWPGMAKYISQQLLDLAAIQLVKNNIVNVENIKNGTFDQSELEKVQNFCSYLRTAFCFGIYCQKQYSLDNPEEMVQNELRICIPQGINPDALFTKLQEQIPLKLKKIKQIQGQNNSIYQLLQVKALYKEDADSDMIQATKALQQLRESNQRPSWQHALLGEKDDGTPFFWNSFMSKDNTVYKRAYQIYAGQRSGKGILTNQLITNALQNGYKVFYVDAKPDTGVQLGSLAWKDGKEAFVFDGARLGQGEHTPGMLEEYQFGLRQPTEWAQEKNQIPRELRTRELPQDLKLNEKDSKGMINSQVVDFGDLIVQVTIYYKCIELIFKMIEYRQRHRGDPKLDWAIFIIDECAKMAEREHQIRNQFFEYIKEFGAKHIDGVPFKPEGKDAQKIVWNDNLQFIQNWLKWLDGIAQQVQTAQTIALGASQSNIFFIFQGQLWMKAYSDTFMVKSLMQLSTTKIIGRNAIENGAYAQYGNKQTKDSYEWAKYIDEPLHWVITEQSDASQCDDNKVHRFKPYSLWGNSREQILNGAPDNYRNIQYYVREIEDMFGIQAQDVLYSAYQYAEDFVQNVYGKQSLKQYIYGMSFLNEGAQGVQADDPNEGKSRDYEFDSSEFSTILRNQGQSGGVDQAQRQSQQVQQGQWKGWETQPAQQRQVLDQQQVPHRTAPQQAQLGAQQRQVPDQQQVPHRTAQQPDQIEQGSYETYINIPIQEQNGEYALNPQQKSTEIANDSNQYIYPENSSLIKMWIQDKRSRYGIHAIKDNASYAFKQAQYNILQANAFINLLCNQVGSYKALENLEIVNNQAYVNGRMIVLPDQMQDPDGYFQMREVVKFEKVFKRFKNLKQIQLDTEMWGQLLEQYKRYGQNRVSIIFRNNRKLMEINVVQPNGQQMKLQREHGLNYVYNMQNDDKVYKAMKKKQAESGTARQQQAARVEKYQNMQFGQRTKQMWKDIKHETWGSPANKAITVAQTVFVFGTIGLALGPIGLIGGTLAQNIVFRKLLHGGK